MSDGSIFALKDLSFKPFHSFKSRLPMTGLEHEKDTVPRDSDLGSASRKPKSSAHGSDAGRFISSSQIIVLNFSMLSRADTYLKSQAPMVKRQNQSGQPQRRVMNSPPAAN
jgi:hypothetical protein